MYRILFEEQCFGADGFGGRLLRVYSRRTTGLHWLGLRLSLSPAQTQSLFKLPCHLEYQVESEPHVAYQSSSFDGP